MDQQSSARSQFWFRVASWPDRNKGNPHLDLLYQALTAQGIHRIEEVQFDLTWLAQRRGDIDGIHIHWPERIWRGRTKGRVDRLRKAITFAQIRHIMNLHWFLRKAREDGIKVLWTVHNIEHHEGASWLDRWGYRTLVRGSDLLITYGVSSEADLREQYPDVGRTLVMGHGNYADQYPQPRSRHDVLTDLGLDPDKPMVCCVGIVRGQKGFELAMDAIRRLNGRVQLVVAGQLHSSIDEGSFRRQIASTPGATLVGRQVSDQEFADIVSASEAVLLPYRQVTGSGVLFAAWSLGRGVIASDLPFFQEMTAAAGNAGTLFRAGDAEDLAAAITRFLRIASEDRRRAADKMARQYSWEKCIEPLVAVFREWEREPVA